MKEEIEGLNGIYKTIAQLTSMDDCLIIYQHFKGLSVTFPTKLMDAQYVKKQLHKELIKEKVFSKQEIQQYAVSFDYSERQIRRFLQEEKRKVKAHETIVDEDELTYTTKWLKKRNDSEKS